jgi:hypothetical protein
MITTTITVASPEAKRVIRYQNEAAAQYALARKALATGDLRWAAYKQRQAAERAHQAMRWLTILQER